MDWQDIKSAPKDVDVLVWFDHEADPYQSPDDTNKLTDYAAWAESGDYMAGSGICVAKWFPQQWERTGEYGDGYFMPECWFAKQMDDYEYPVTFGRDDATARAQCTARAVKPQCPADLARMIKQADTTKP